MSNTKIKKERLSKFQKVKGFLLKHWFLTLVLTLAFGAALNWYFKSGQADMPEYITEKATRRDVVREVSVNGQIKAKESRELAASMTEEVVSVLVEEDEVVQAGDVLVEFDSAALELRLGQAKAQLAQAQAVLDRQLAGATGSDIALSQNDVQSAQVALQAAKDNLEKLIEQKENNVDIADLNVKTSELALKNANIRFANTQNNTGQNSSLSEDQLADALESAVTVYKTAWTEIKEAQITANAVIKEDRFASETSRFGDVIFGNKNSILTSKTKQDYREFKLHLNNFESTYAPAFQSLWTDANEALNKLKQIETLANEGTMLLSTTADLASATIDVSQIDNARSDVKIVERKLLTEVTKIQSAIQSIDSAQLNIGSGGSQNTTTIDNVRADFDTISSQYEQAEYNKDQIIIQADTAIAQAQAEVSARQVALNRALNGLGKVQEDPRDVDLGANQAAVQMAENQVAQAQLALDEAQVVSPIDGLVTIVNAKTGERPNAALPLVVIKSQDLEIIADIPETDIGDVQVGQTAQVTFDAFSSQDIYTATVVKKAKAETVVQGVIYYQVTLELEETQDHDLERVLSGMTADIELLIDSRESVFALEPQAIIYNNGQPHTRLLQETEGMKTVEERAVELGLEGNTYVEILNGLGAEDVVILYEDLGTRNPFE